MFLRLTRKCVLSINYIIFKDHLHKMYFNKVEIKGTTESDKTTFNRYLDKLLSLANNGYLIIS